MVALSADTFEAEENGLHQPLYKAKPFHITISSSERER
jgi:hypothetical protein